MTTTQYFNLELFDLFGESIDCSICLEPIKEGQRTVLIRKCQHGFHQGCLDPWLLTNTTCPNCRTSALLDVTGPTPAQIIELDRIYLTYVLYTWILNTFNSDRFRRNYTPLREFLTNFQWNTRRPFPFDFRMRNRISLSATRILRSYLIEREETLYRQMYPEEVHRIIHRNPRVREIQAAVQQELASVSQRLE